jgi:hypothetical protein
LAALLHSHDLETAGGKDKLGGTLAGLHFSEILEVAGVVQHYIVVLVAPGLGWKR